MRLQSLTFFAKFTMSVIEIRTLYIKQKEVRIMFYDLVDYIENGMIGAVKAAMFPFKVGAVVADTTGNYIMTKMTNKLLETQKETVEDLLKVYM